MENFKDFEQAIQGASTDEDLLQVVKEAKKRIDLENKIAQSKEDFLTLMGDVNRVFDLSSEHNPDKLKSKIPTIYEYCNTYSSSGDMFFDTKTIFDLLNTRESLFDMLHKKLPKDKTYQKQRIEYIQKIKEIIDDRKYVSHMIQAYDFLNKRKIATDLRAVFLHDYSINDENFRKDIEEFLVEDLIAFVMQLTKGVLEGEQIKTFARMIKWGGIRYEKEKRKITSKEGKCYLPSFVYDYLEYLSTFTDEDEGRSIFDLIHQMNEKTIRKNFIHLNPS